MQARKQLNQTPAVTAHPVYHTTLDGCGCPDYTQWKRTPAFSTPDKRRCSHIAAAEAEIIHFGTTLCGRNGEPSCSCCEFTDGADDCNHIKLLQQSKGPAPKAPALAKERPVAVYQAEICFICCSEYNAESSAHAPFCSEHCEDRYNNPNDFHPHRTPSIKDRPVAVVEEFTGPMTLEQRQTITADRRHAFSKLAEEARTQILHQGFLSNELVDRFERDYGIGEDDDFWEAVEPAYAMSQGYVPDADWDDALSPFSSEYQAWERSHGPSGHRLSAQR